MIALGVDISLTGTGFCVISSTGEILDYGLIPTKPGQHSKNPDKDKLKRIDWIFHEILALLVKRYQGECVSCVAVEGYALSVPVKRNRSLCDLAEIGGLVKNGLLARSIPFIIAPPTCLKRYVTGKGNASKEDVKNHVSTKFLLTTKNDNIADACGLARMARSQFIDGTGLEEYQRDTLSKCHIIGA